jgi:hypothetical protein
MLQTKLKPNDTGIFKKARRTDNYKNITHHNKLLVETSDILVNN